MVKLFIPGLITLLLMSQAAHAQKVKSADLPSAVKTALAQEFPAATGVTWEKEKGNYEANWGGKSNEDNSVIFTPQGIFVEKAVAVAVSDLPAAVATYVKKNYPGSRIHEAGKVTDAHGKITYEAEVKGKDLVFDENGNFLRREEE